MDIRWGKGDLARRIGYILQNVLRPITLVYINKWLAMNVSGSP